MPRVRPLPILAVALAAMALAFDGAPAPAQGLAGVGQQAAPESSGGEEKEPPYSPVEGLNVGLPRLDDPPDLETPQSALENFDLSAGRGDFARAAYSLNLNAIAPGRQPEAGARLARQLKAVMDRQVWFKWADIPDRPDGKDDAPSLKAAGGGSDGPRSSLKLASLTIGERDAEIRLQRVKPKGGTPVWVFSRQTVDHIPALFEEFAPRSVEASMPAFLKARKFAKIALWQWIGFAVILLAGVAFGWIVQKALKALLRRFSWRWAQILAEAIRGPGEVAVGIWAFRYLAGQYLNLAGPIVVALDPLFIAVIVAGLVWFVQRLIRLIAAAISGRYATFNSDEANVTITRLSVARHFLTFVVVVGGTIYALSGFEWFRQVGSTILASAGLAGLVIGIAAQRLLGNLFAGITLAVTQPVKAGDAVLFEDEFGWIEEIDLVYLVIRFWDLRRVVVPISYFMDHPIQNWSRNSQQLMFPVYVRADYRVDVGAVREELKAILEDSEDWDRVVPPILQVTSCNDDTIELRALCSAGDPTSSWNLQCHVRERLIRYLREHEGGRYLPRKRISMVGRDVKVPEADGGRDEVPPDGTPQGVPKEAVPEPAGNPAS